MIGETRKTIGRSPSLVAVQGRYYYYPTSDEYQGRDMSSCVSPNRFDEACFEIIGLLGDSNYAKGEKQFSFFTGKIEIVGMLNWEFGIFWGFSFSK